MLANHSYLPKIAYWLPPLLCAGAIFWFSSQSTLPGFQLSIFDFFFKKIAHMVAFAALYFYTRRAIKLTYPQLSAQDWRVWFLPLLICLCYAATDEFHQAFIPNRTASFRDVVYDFIGMGSVFLRQNRFI